MISTNAVAVMATVDYIFDGDTFAGVVHISDDIDVDVRVRLINIDTPEIHGMCDSETRMALRARDRLAELIPTHTRIKLTEIQDDKYLGRIDARVFDADGRDVGNILIQEKLARPYSGGKRQSWCE